MEKNLDKSHPTPTQEECDKLKMGEVIEHLEPDGSDEEPQPQIHVRGKKAMEAKPAGGGGYQTRATRPAPTSTHSAPTHARSSE